MIGTQKLYLFILYFAVILTFSTCFKYKNQLKNGGLDASLHVLP